MLGVSLFRVHITKVAPTAPAILAQGGVGQTQAPAVLDPLEDDTGCLLPVLSCSFLKMCQRSCRKEVSLRTAVLDWLQNGIVGPSTVLSRLSASQKERRARACGAPSARTSPRPTVLRELRCSRPSKCFSAPLRFSVGPLEFL